MDQLPEQPVLDHDLELIPPKRDDRHLHNTVTCLCCRKKRLASAMDADGCGICEECLAS
ncbi:hypothetical protein SAMN03159448_04050 [Sinorhizobium sp. NFACC03]|nr:hypothetical protein SAMN03159448_04050 [Sinorhizobium sp. NFACC03]